MNKHFLVMMTLALSSAAMAQTFGARPAASQPDSTASSSGAPASNIDNPVASGTGTAVPPTPAAIPKLGTPTAPGGIAPATGNAAGGTANPSSAAGSSPGGAMQGAGNGTAAMQQGNGAAATAPGAGMAAGATTGQGSNAAATATGSATRFDPGSVPGWSMMTPQEQQAYSDRMNSITTLGQCRAFQQTVMAQMQSRARAIGQTLAHRQDADPCAAMQRQGTLQR